MAGWEEWEQPWSRADGVYREYTPMSRAPEVGDTVAVRQVSKPYLPTFSPWWPNLVVKSIDGDLVTFENAPNFTASLERHPLATHWAVTTDA